MPQQGSKGRAKHLGLESFKATKASRWMHEAHNNKVHSRSPYKKLRHRLMVGSQIAAMQHKINKRKKI